MGLINLKNRKLFNRVSDNKLVNIIFNEIKYL